jgi:hypothetical protein
MARSRRIKRSIARKSPQNAGFRRERTCFQDVFHAFFAISYLKSVNYMLIRLFQPDDKKFFQTPDSKANDSQKSVYS